jgi:hypothetical protein
MKRIYLASFVALIVGTVLVLLCRREAIGPSISNPSKQFNPGLQDPDQQMAEVVLRHLFLNNGSGTKDDQLLSFKTCFISVDLTKYSNYSDFYNRFVSGAVKGHQYSSTAPPAQFMECLWDVKLSLRPASSGGWFPGFTQNGHNYCIVFYINGIIGGSAERAIVMAGYYFNSTNAGEYEYTIKLSDGQWKVEKVECISMS